MLNGSINNLFTKIKCRLSLSNSAAESDCTFLLTLTSRLFAALRDFTFEYQCLPQIGISQKLLEKKEQSTSEGDTPKPYLVYIM